MLEPIHYPLNQPGSRYTVNTPGLVLDLDALEYNIACMARGLHDAGCQLRPHAKAHKCPEIAKCTIAPGLDL